MSPELTPRGLGRVADSIVHRFTAFGGSACEIRVLDGSDADVSAAVAEVYAFESQLTRFRADSELSLFNGRAGESVEVSPLLEALLRAALIAHDLSDGLVNAAVGNALVAAGYDRSIEQVRGGASVPAANGAPVPPLPELVEVGHGSARLRHGYAIDLGGIGKGWLADRLCERFDDACVNLGGDLRARGMGPGGDGWTVGLVDGEIVSVRDGGVASSGTVGRRWPGGHHIIDPRSGLSAVTDALAVSVAARDALTAEVLAKAAVILGSRAAGAWLHGHGAVQHAAIWCDEVGVAS